MWISMQAQQNYTITWIKGRLSNTCMNTYLQVGLVIRVDLDPMTMKPRRARVSATFSRRTSAKNPILPCALERTALKMMTSLSCPAVRSSTLISSVFSACIACQICPYPAQLQLNRSHYARHITPVTSHPDGLEMQQLVHS